jgi:organic hydroperoxide reductase OsmC/OhrA
VQADNLVVHMYTLREGLVERMDVDVPDHRVHRYRAHVAWRGSTKNGYDAYNRTHTATAPPAQAQLALTSDPAFKGDPTHLNPEQLVVLAASSCQLLSFLAVAARARIDVTKYEDDAEAQMPEGDRPTRITKIVLRPRIEIRSDATEQRLRRLVQTAHDQCFVANSLRTEVVVRPTFIRSEA